MDEKIQNIRDLISHGKIETALTMLKAELKNSGRLNSVILQESRLAEIKKDEIAGTIDNDDALKLTNQVVAATLNLISDWENTRSGENEKNIGTATDLKLVEEDVVQEIAEGFKNSISFYTWIAILPFIISLGFLGFVFFTSETVDTVQILASTLIASICAFPIREIINRKEKISMLNVLIKKIRLLKSSPIDLEIKKVNEAFWKIVNSTFSKSLKTESNG